MSGAVFASVAASAPAVPNRPAAALAVLIDAAAALGRRMRGAAADLAPIVGVIAFFQLVVLRQPFPNLAEVAVGMLCVVAGLALFVQGLESGLFPLGEAIARAFAKQGSATALLAFAFCLGFGTTVAEPALIAVAAEAAAVAADAGFIQATEAEQGAYAFHLRMVVAASVGAAIVLGVLRILKGWPLHLLIIGGYGIVTGMTLFACPRRRGATTCRCTPSPPPSASRPPWRNPR